MVEGLKRLVLVSKLKRNLSDGLIENAKDSFTLGAEFFVQKGRKTYLKHTVLNLFHATELFLKARLAKVHPILGCVFNLAERIEFTFRS